jgi:hypothetical protein
LTIVEMDMTLALRMGGRIARKLRGSGLIAVMALTAACANETPLQWAPPIELDSGEAYRGPWRMNASVFLFVDDPTVVITDNETTVAAWVDQSQRDVLVQVYDPDGRPRHEAPVNVSGTPDVFSWLPRMAVGGDDAEEIYVLWQEIVFSGGSHGGEIFFTRSLDGGASFSEPINLSNTIAGAGKGRLTRDHWHNGSLDLLRGRDGTLYVA